MPRLTITGASGFLGGVIVESALRNKQFEHVTASDVMPSDLSRKNLTVLTCDLQNSALTDAVAAADVVIHLAATLGAAAEADPVTAKQVNLDATLNLIAHCKRGTRFVFASSLAVLGESSNERAPVMIYGAHKAMAEIAIETATLSTNLGPARSLTLPMQKVGFADLVKALQTAFPDSTSEINFAPQDETMRLFGTAQPLSFTDSLNAGFKPDTNLASLIKNAMQNRELL